MLGPRRGLSRSFRSICFHIVVSTPSFASSAGTSSCHGDFFDIERKTRLNGNTAGRIERVSIYLLHREPIVVESTIMYYYGFATLRLWWNGPAAIKSPSFFIAWKTLDIAMKVAWLRWKCFFSFWQSCRAFWNVCRGLQSFWRKCLHRFLEVLEFCEICSLDFKRSAL